MLQSVIHNPDQKERLLQYFQHLLNNSDQFQVEKKKTPTSGILFRQVTFTQDGFRQANGKVIPFTSEFVFQTREEFEGLPQDLKKFPWTSKSDAGARVYFCRKDNNLTQSVVSNFQKPTCVYFLNRQQAQDIANFKKLLYLDQQQLIRVPHYSQYIQNKILTMFTQQTIRLLQSKADQIREAKHKRKIALCSQGFMRRFDRIRISTAINAMRDNAHQNKVEYEIALREKTKAEMIARRRRLIMGSKLLDKADSTQLNAMLKDWAQRSYILNMEEQKKQEEDRILALYIEEQEQASEQSQVMEDIPEPIFNEPVVEQIVEAPPPLDKESIHTPIQMTSFCLYLDKSFRLQSPKIQFIFSKPDDGLPRQRTVQPSRADSVFLNQIQPRLSTQQFLIEPRQSNQSAQSQPRNHASYFEDTYDLQQQPMNEICGKCSKLNTQLQLNIQGYSLKDKVDIIIFDDEVNLNSSEKESRKIFYGTIKFFQINKNSQRFQRHFLPLELTYDFKKHHLENAVQNWSDHPMLQIELKFTDADPTIEDFTQFLKKSSTIACSGEGNIQDNNYFEVLRYPLNQRDYSLFHQKGPNKTEIWQAKRLKDLELALHNRGHSYSNALWSRSEVGEMMSEKEEGGEEVSQHSFNLTDGTQTKRKFNYLDQVVKSIDQSNLSNVSQQQLARLLQILRRGLEHHDRPQFFFVVCNRIYQQISNSLRDKVQPEQPRQSQHREIIGSMTNSLNQSTNQGGFIQQLLQSSREKIDVGIAQSIEQDSISFYQHLKSQLSFPTQSNEQLIKRFEEVRNLAVQVVQAQTKINQEFNQVVYSSHLMRLGFRVVQLHYQIQSSHIKFEQCVQLLQMLWSLVAKKEQNRLSQDNIDLIFNYVLLQVDPQLKQQLLSLNVEYYMVDHILTCFCEFFCWEAWTRVLDFIVCQWWSELIKNFDKPLLKLVAIVLTILQMNLTQLLSAKSATEFISILKIFGHITINIDQFIQTLDKVYLQLCETFDLTPVQKLYDEKIQASLKLKGEQLSLIKDFMSGRNIQLSHVQHFVMLQAVFDPYRRLAEFQRLPEDADIEVPEEHDNSILRDMQTLERDIEEVNVRGKSESYQIQADEEVPRLISKPNLNMIYLLIHDLKVHTNDLNLKELQIRYGINQQVYPLSTQDWPDNSFYVQYQFKPNVWDIELCYALQKKKGQVQDGKILKDLKIDIRRFRVDTIYKLDVELRDCPPLEDRHYVRSTAQISILVTKQDSIGKAPYLEQRFLQQQLYEENPSVKQIQNIDVQFHRSLTQVTRSVVDFENVQQYVFQIAQWKSDSITKYEDFKRIIKIIFNVDSTQFQLSQLFRIHRSVNAGSPFYLLDFWMNLIILLPGSFQLKLSVIYDLVQLYQHTTTSPEMGLLPEQVQSVIQCLYQLCNIPINQMIFDEGFIVKATITEQKGDIYLDDSTMKKPVCLDITNQLNQIVNYKHFRWLNKDLLLIDNENKLFFIRQCLTQDQLKLLFANKAEQFVVQIKYWSDSRLHRANYVVDREFKLMNSWQQRKQGTKSVEQVLEENRRVLQIQGQKGRLVTKKEFIKIFHTLPGLEYLMASMSQQAETTDIGEPQIMLFNQFRKYAQVTLTIGGKIYNDDHYIMLNSQAKKFYNDIRNTKQIKQRTFGDDTLVNLKIEIPSVYISSELLMTIVETSLLTYVSGENIPSECFELEINNMAKTFYFKDKSSYHQLTNVQDLSFVDITILCHNKEFAINYDYVAAQPNEDYHLQKESKKKNDGFPHLAFVHYPDVVKTLKPCRLDHYVPKGDDQIKCIGVNFQQDPESLIYVKPTELMCLDLIDIKELDCKQKPWKHEVVLNHIEPKH